MCAWLEAQERKPIPLWSVGFSGTDVSQAVSEAGVMLMGSQLCLIITAQSKRGLEPL